MVQIVIQELSLFPAYDGGEVRASRVFNAISRSRKHPLRDRIVEALKTRGFVGSGRDMRCLIKHAKVVSNDIEAAKMNPKKQKSST